MLGLASFEDQFVQELLSTKALARLQDVTFLGAIDYLQPSNGKQIHRRRNNRFEHTVGVAKLVASYCDAKKLTVKESRPLIAAALLHDVGHGPLSHTLEQIFKTYFGVDHHLVGLSYVRGQNDLGRELNRIFQSWHIDREQIIEIIEGKSTGQHSFLFSSTHNVDTLEAITRSISMVRRSLAPRSAEFYFQTLWLGESFSQPEGDDFWRLKDTVYHVLINGSAGRFMDSVAQSYMMVNLNAFSAADFSLTDHNFMKKFRKLHQLLLRVLPLAELQSELDDKMLSTKLELTRRRFVIDERISASNMRYKQTKKQLHGHLSDYLSPLYEHSLIQHQHQLELVAL